MKRYETHCKLFCYIEMVTQPLDLQAPNNKLQAYCCSFQVCNLEKNEQHLLGILAVLEVVGSLTSHSFVPVFFPRILEGQITWPRGGHPPWCHRLYSNCCQERLVSSQWCTAQFCKGEDLGQESKWAHVVYIWKCLFSWMGLAAGESISAFTSPVIVGTCFQLR